MRHLKSEYISPVSSAFFKTQASVCLIALAQLTHANPSGGQVVSGDVNIQSGQHTVIQQNSDAAIINWQDFSIDIDEHTQFIQPGGDSVVLNRVISNNPSNILGKLSANGRVFLVNPNGILFGVNSQIDVGGLVASTANISNENFMNGNYVFDEAGVAGAEIINYGNITTISDHGLVALVAPFVENNGIIQAKLGKVALAAGDRWTLDLYGDNLITFAVTPGKAETIYKVSQSGKISANGGVVLITAQSADDMLESVINMNGIIEAKTVGEQSGRIVLLGHENSLVNIAGTLDVSGTLTDEVAGLIQITGDEVTLGNEFGVLTFLKAMGDSGGGVVHIGGALQGGEGLATAGTTVVHQGVNINADALQNGNGGEVVVWSDNETVFSGQISARGGELSGDGGFVETSSKNVIHIIDGMVTTLAPMGKAGTWLLDPVNYTINAAVEATILAGLTNNAIFQIQADEDITVEADYDFTWANDNTLELLAGNDIIFGDNSSIANTSAGALNLRADADADGNGTVTFGAGSGVDYSGSTGAVNLFYNPVNYANPTDYSSFVTAGANKFTPYMLVNNLTDLQSMSTNLDGIYAFGADINAVATAVMNGGLGFDPIGDSDNPFTGTLNMNGYTLSNIIINRPNEDFVALIGASLGATYQNINITSAVSTGNNFVSGFIGKSNEDTITGTVGVTGLINGDDFVGGVFGSIEEGTIVVDQVLSQTNVNGHDYVGGISGAAVNNIIQGNLFHVGNVTGNDFVGGLVGLLTRDVLIVGLVFNNGDVTGNSNVGGIAGIVSGVAFDIDSTVGLGGLSGNVSGNDSAGGIIGVLDTTDTEQGFVEFFGVNGAGGLDRFIGRELASSQAQGADTASNVNQIFNEAVDSSAYQQILSESALFSYGRYQADSQVGDFVSSYKASEIFKSISTDLIGGLFESAFDETGSIRTGRFTSSFMANVANVMEKSNERMSASSVVAMGAGVGGLILSSNNGLLQNAFGQSMGANLMAMFGIVSMTQENADGSTRVADNNLPVGVPDVEAMADSSWCGVTCKLVMLSMQSPTDVPNFSENLNVNPSLYVNSSVRPNSEVEQRYTWDATQDRYVQTRTMFRDAELTPSSVIIRQPI